MQNELINEIDLRESERLHRIYDQAKAAFDKAVPELDGLNLKYMEARLMEYAAGSLCSAIPERITTSLKAQTEQAQAERDAATKAAEIPLKEARDAAQRFDGRFINAAMNFFGFFERTYNFDSELLQLCLGTRKQLDRLQRDVRPLSEIFALFEDARGKIERWKLNVPAHDSSVFSGQRGYPDRLSIPRIQDFLR